jgi:hypothetical protein
MALSTLELLMALNGGNNPNLPDIPQPARPVIGAGPIAPPATPQYGGPSQVVEPPQAPLDTRIIQQYLQAQGPAPQAPQPLSRGRRIANAIAAFGAGVEGRGPEFLRQLNEPQRRYEAQLEDYNQRGASLRVRGTEAALRDQENRTERAQRIADRQSEEEFQRESRRLNLYDDESKMRLAHAFSLERDAKQARLEQTRELERERRAMELDAKQKTSQFFTASKNMALSRELGAHYAGLSDAPLSPAAVRLDQQLQGVQQARMGRAMGAGGRTGASSGAMKALQNFEAAKQAVIAAVGRGDVRAERLARRKLDAMVGQLARYPAQIEYGGDPQWPYAKLKGAQQPQVGAQPQAANVRTMAQIRQLAAQAGISEQEAVQRAQAAGFQITQ